MPKKTRASNGVLYEYLTEVVRDCDYAICLAWADLYHVSDEDFEKPEELSTAQLLGLAQAVCEAIEDEEVA